MNRYVTLRLDRQHGSLMPNYTFLDLSPLDFEDLGRDLLQKELNIRFESFGPGADGGIDFRYSTNKTNGIVVQCKRYEHWRDLLPVLKKEVEKVKKLKPERYILVVSCHVTDAQKNKIVKLFDPYIRNKSDIKGRGDLNNLLTDHKDVEMDHPKLWIPTTNVLEKIVHSRVINQGITEKKHVERALQIYVENESYARAVRILNERRWVIISGIPGIGKTTLARILVASYLAQGFEDVVVASDSMKDAFELKKDKVSQIFFFDDFLGRTFQNKDLPTNEDARIKTFIDIAESNKNKIFILTTREYILSQAMQRYEFRERSIELSKCLVDLAHYTRNNRARILYNHLYYSNIGEEHLNDILRDKNYLTIIDHKNYSPRIVEEMISIDDMWKSILPGEFTNRILHYLENQEQIWSTAYESGISEFSQCILVNMISAGTPIFYEDLQRIMQSFGERFSQKYGFTFSGLDFKKSMKELERCFISIDKQTYGSKHLVNFHNPSIEDFLMNYLALDDDLICDILEAAPFFNQFFNIFVLDGSAAVEAFQGKLRGRLILGGRAKEIVLSRLISELSDLGSSELQSKEFPHRKAEGKYSRLDVFRSETRGLKDPRINEFLRNEFEKVMSPKNIESYDDYSNFVSISRRLGPDFFPDKEDVLERYFARVKHFYQFENFEKLETLFPDEFAEFTRTDDFREHMRGVIEREIDDANDEDDLETVLEEAERLYDDYDVFIDDLKDTIEEKVAEEQEKKEEEAETITLPTSDDEDDDDEANDDDEQEDEEMNIDSMFDSLRRDRSD